jgi:hypothetical protein
MTLRSTHIDVEGRRERRKDALVVQTQRLWDTMRGLGEPGRTVELSMGTMRE